VTAAARRPTDEATGSRRARAGVPFLYWPLWMTSLAVGLVLFYGILTPIWMLVRVVAWASDRPLFRSR
jgi:hypothetical protein